MGVVITLSKSSEFYVGNDLGNASKNYFVSYYKCQTIANNIPDENLVVFKSKEEALHSKFKPVDGCV